MENIFQPNEQFDFSNITLAHPTGIQGGAYFTKIQYYNKPLYIQCPKSLTKQGFVKTGKKIYCDLMFDINNEKIIHWLEKLENRCQELIYEKGDNWFENKLEKNDIETAFTSPIRVYKSGKYYLVRANVKMNYNTNIPLLKIYNESEIPVTIDDVNSDTNIVSIIEVQGIKFTSRNFQIEIDLKQVMVLSTDKIFESCLIKTIDGKNNTNNVSSNKIQNNNVILTDNSVVKNQLLETLSTQIVNEKLEENIFSDNADKSKQQKEDKTLSNNIENVDLNIENIFDDNINDLREIDINSDINDLETITLKKPNQVYYEIYKAARKKAKLAKKQAIIAFLEAKNIKKIYMLDDLNDSDSDDELNNLSDYSENDLENDLEKE